MRNRTRQDPPRIQHRAFFTALPNVLATNLALERGLNKRRLWQGLERFVNCGDSEQDYQALAKAYPDLWPLEGSHWVPGGHRLFLCYRDTLRRVWEHDKRSIECGDTGFLLGIYGFSGRFPQRFKDALRVLGHPSAEAWQLPGRAVLWPDWETGHVSYSSQNNFQRAFYFLFREHWRARVCPLCKLYFVAQRPRQKFCSLSCSSRSRLQSNLGWWNRVGAARRRKQSQKAPRRKR